MESKVVVYFRFGVIVCGLLLFCFAWSCSKVGHKDDSGDYIIDCFSSGFDDRVDKFGYVKIFFPFHAVTKLNNTGNIKYPVPGGLWKCRETSSQKEEYNREMVECKISDSKTEFKMRAIVLKGKMLKNRKSTSYYMDYMLNAGLCIGYDAITEFEEHPRSVKNGDGLMRIIKASSNDNEGIIVYAIVYSVKGSIVFLTVSGTDDDKLWEKHRDYAYCWIASVVFAGMNINGHAQEATYCKEY